VQDEVAKTTDILKSFEDWKLEGQKVRSRVRWRSSGDRVSKEFFQAIQECTSQSHITDLLDRNEALCSFQADIQRAYKKFYAELYAHRPDSSATVDSQTWAFNELNKRLTPAMVQRLDQPITLAKLTQALAEMATSKTPSPDGIVTKFFKCMWATIGAEYLNMLQESINRGHFPARVTERLIVLLHKGGDRRPLGTWWPITLLNTTYKLFAKTLQKRLQPVLMELISPDQSAFLPIRFILDNIFLTYETIAYAKQTHQPLLFLKLDFSNAYDKVDLKFLFATLEHLGFPDLFF
jgi:hypothetical protein